MILVFFVPLMCFVDGVPFLRCLGFTFQRLVFILSNYFQLRACGFQNESSTMFHGVVVNLVKWRVCCFQSLPRLSAGGRGFLGKHQTVGVDFHPRLENSTLLDPK